MFLAILDIFEESCENLSKHKKINIWSVYKYLNKNFTET